MIPNVLVSRALSGAATNALFYSSTLLLFYFLALNPTRHSYSKLTT